MPAKPLHRILDYAEKQHPSMIGTGMQNPGRARRLTTIVVTILSALGVSQVAAIAADATPGSPSNAVVSEVTGASLLVSWDAPVLAPSAVTDYELQFSSDNGANWTVFSDGLSLMTQMRVTGLKQGVNYQLQIRAVGTGGASQWSAVGVVSTQVTLGRGFACALQSSGEVKCWGLNDAGQVVEDGNYEYHSPVTTPGIGNAVEVSSGNIHSCARLSDGHVECWGSNAWRQLGVDFEQLDGNFDYPTPVDGITNAAQISAGGNHSCAVLTTGEVDCWGSNYNGQVGDDTNEEVISPFAVPGISNAIQVSGGEMHTCALLSNGHVQCWGDNSKGQLGDGTTDWSVTPVTVTGLANATQISVGSDHSCALLSTGQIKCWGYTMDGLLGDGTTNLVVRSTPVAVRGITNATEVTSGTFHSCARLATGQLKCWGSNYGGQLGNGTKDWSAIPVTVSGIANAAAVSAGNGEFSCALLTGGQVKCWGVNENGELGNGTTVGRTTPIATLLESGTYQLLSAPTYRAGAKVSGTTAIGKSLTAQAGTWVGSPTPAITYQWYACTKASKTVSIVGKVASGCKLVRSATKPSLKLTTALKKLYMAVLITAKNASGTKKVFTATIGTVK